MYQSIIVGGNSGPATAGTCSRCRWARLNTSQPTSEELEHARDKEQANEKVYSRELLMPVPNASLKATCNLLDHSPCGGLQLKKMKSNPIEVQIHALTA